MGAGDGSYIAVTDIANDFALSRKIISSDFGTPTSPNAIPESILEAESYIEGFLMPMGFDRPTLQSCPLVKQLCLMYARYAVMRDIFSNIAPSEKDQAVYDKWKTDLDAKLTQITDPTSAQKIHLVDSNGQLLTRTNEDFRFMPATTTPNVDRIITTDDPSTWGVDESNSDPTVIGATGSQGIDPQHNVIPGTE